jgi:hypothetical protein
MRFNWVEQTHCGDINIQKDVLDIYNEVKCFIRHVSFSIVPKGRPFSPNKEFILSDTCPPTRDPKPDPTNGTLYRIQQSTGHVIQIHDSYRQQIIGEANVNKTLHYTINRD